MCVLNKVSKLFQNLPLGPFICWASYVQIIQRKTDQLNTNNGHVAQGKLTS